MILVLGIDIGRFTGLGTSRDVSKLLSAMGITYPAGFTEDGDVVLDYQILYMPTTLFISPKGEIVRRFEGGVGEETLERYLEEIF